MFTEFKLCFQSGKIHASGNQKVEVLQNLLQKELLELENFLCQKFEKIFDPIKSSTGALHSCVLPVKQKTHCGK